MSKAFTKENDSNEDLEDRKQLETLSVKVKNYVTPNGFSEMQDELRHLMNNERPKVVATVQWAASNGDRSENADYIYGKRRLREIDKRIRYLTKRLESAEVIDPEQQKHFTQVFFGATVTYELADCTEITVKIVGVDEADLSKGKISWISPVAKSLMKSAIGDIIEIKTPAGSETVKISIIKY
jgi:transcription elongation factor GreB